jgi:hypothetical protein
MTAIAVVAAVVAVALAARSQYGTMVLGRLWLVASALWMLLAAWDLALLPGAPALGWHPGMIRILLEILGPPVAVLLLFRTVAWTTAPPRQRP